MSNTAEDARIYPCAECGTMRTKAEGGTTFTVCDACWDKKHMSNTPRTDAEMERNLGDPSPEFTRGLELELAALRKDNAAQADRIEELEQAVHDLNSYDAPTEIQLMRESVGELRKDKERLDWLENCEPKPHAYYVAIINRTPYRAAIDAAIAQRPSP